MAEEKSCSKCGWRLRADNTKGVCGDAAACRRRCAKADGGGHPVPHEEPAVPALRPDVVEILKQELEHHRSQAARIQRAIEALS